METSADLDALTSLSSDGCILTPRFRESPYEDVLMTVKKSAREEHMLIDTSFDFRTDASGKDPDAYSPTLRQYHKLLWSKALPSGERVRSR